MNSILLAWIHGVWPPEHRAGRTSTWRYSRTGDHGPEQWVITITEDDVRETWKVAEAVVEDVSRMPLPDGQKVDAWFDGRHQELEAEGWKLAMLGTSMDIHMPRDASGGWISGACI